MERVKYLLHVFYRIGNFNLYDKKRFAMGAHSHAYGILPAKPAVPGARVSLAKLFFMVDKRPGTDYSIDRYLDNCLNIYIINLAI